MESVHLATITNKDTSVLNINSMLEIKKSRIPEMLDALAQAAAKTGLGNTNDELIGKWRAWIENVLGTYLGEAWTDEKHCVACGAGMNAYVSHVDYTNAVAMLKLGKVVRDRIAKGTPFTDANKIHLQSAEGLTATQIDRRTHLKYLGLIAKVKVEGKHKDALWAITRRGFQFLRNEPIPDHVVFWRKEVIEVSEDTTTLSEVLKAKDETIETHDWKTNCFEIV